MDPMWDHISYGSGSGGGGDWSDRHKIAFVIVIGTMLSIFAGVMGSILGACQAIILSILPGVATLLAIRAIWRERDERLRKLSRYDRGLGDILDQSASRETQTSVNKIRRIGRED